MSRKKKKSSAAENLIESLMDDLKDIHDESSYKSASSVDEFAGLRSLDVDKNRVDQIKSAEDILLNFGGDLGKDIEKGIEKELDSFEFTGGVEEAPTLEKDPSPGLDMPETRPVGGFVGNSGGEDKTMSIQQEMNNVSSVFGTTESENTVAVEGFANARVGARAKNVDVKVSIGSHRGGRVGANVLTSIDASLAQAENLKLAQQRILELEKEVENLRAENEDLASAGEIIRSRADELGICVAALEKEKVEIKESAQSEMLILKGNLQYKENEVAKARVKVEELEARLKSDFKRIRVRERELENRLELLRAEKSALVRSKDEYILEQKRKIDQLSQELDNYRKKCLELNKTIEANQDQVKRTERALRLALTNLEAKEENNGPLKKAE